MVFMTQIHINQKEINFCTNLEACCGKGNKKSIICKNDTGIPSRVGK
jgi:hypothetical protein